MDMITHVSESVVGYEISGSAYSEIGFVSGIFHSQLMKERKPALLLSHLTVCGNPFITVDQDSFRLRGEQGISFPPASPRSRSS